MRRPEPPTGQPQVLLAPRLCMQAHALRFTHSPAQECEVRSKTPPITSSRLYTAEGSREAWGLRASRSLAKRNPTGNGQRQTQGP